jgi:thiamine-monophosphate kinase
VRARRLSVTSVDTMVDGVHFRTGPGWLDHEDVGWRALAAALSDLAAMGASPGEAYLALGLPPGSREPEVIALIRGAGALAAESGVLIAGGDLVAAPALLVSFTVVGWADEERALIRRDGARVGDRVAVTGTLGGAAAALACRERGEPAPPDLDDRYRRPRPRLAEGARLARAGVHAMIDLSDGLTVDAGHLAERSGASIDLQTRALPLQPGLDHAAADRDPVELALSGGDDYELLVCAPPGAELPDVTFIGQVTDGPAGTVTIDGAKPADDDHDGGGYEHRW